MNNEEVYPDSVGEKQNDGCLNCLGCLFIIFLLTGGFGMFMAWLGKWF